MDEDEAWLYGDSDKKEENGNKEGEDSAPAGTEDIADGDSQEDKEAGEVSGEEGETADAAGNEATGDDDDDDDDSDDDIQVTIGDIKTQTSYEKTSFKYQRGGAQMKAAPVKGVDVEAIGTINGVPLFEYDINSLQPDEKPWRKPGADITDYFNYGFTEDTWIKYCEKQRKMRTEAGVSSGVFQMHHTSNLKPVNTRPNNTTIITTETKTPEVIGVVSPGSKKAGPPPGRKMSGTIDVIGSTIMTTRRVKASDFDPTDPNDFQKKFPGGIPPGGMPNTSQPPPPVSVPPAGFGIPPPIITGPPMGIPPPGMGGPPPGMPPPGAPVGYPIPQPGFFPPPGMPPPDSRGPPPGFGFDGFNVGPPPGFAGPPPTSGPPPWENRPPGFNSGWSDYGGRSPRRSDSELSGGSDDERRGRFRRGERDTYDRYRDEREYYEPRSRSRDRDRDRRYRERDHDRSRERDRDRSREKDRERDRDRDRDRERERGGGEREERHRSSRRKHDDEEHHRSKHKKSKRSRKDKEEEGAEGGNPPSSQDAEPSSQ